MELLLIEYSGGVLQFKRVHLEFKEFGLRNVFAAKNNRSLEQTLAGLRYTHLSADVTATHRLALPSPLGDFLATLKQQNDSLYKRFLNRYGDETYCRFKIGEGTYKRQTGLYLFRLKGQIVYLGRSNDPIEKRLNQGYGIIHPKNCYLDGQSTNCHLNSLIAATNGDVDLFACPISGRDAINCIERELIIKLKPQWNIALNS